MAFKVKLSCANSYWLPKYTSTGMFKCADEGVGLVVYKMLAMEPKFQHF